MNISKMKNFEPTRNFKKYFFENIVKMFNYSKKCARNCGNILKEHKLMGTI